VRTSDDLGKFGGTVTRKKVACFGEDYQRYSVGEEVPLTVALLIVLGTCVPLPRNGDDRGTEPLGICVEQGGEVVDRELAVGSHSAHKGAGIVWIHSRQVRAQAAQPVRGASISVNAVHLDETGQTSSDRSGRTREGEHAA
jgi:hypothetical protein